MNAAAQGYNERLFSGGLRTRFHLARFHWLQCEIRKRGLACESVLELGCFDGKLNGFMPVPPRRYLGFDANWEGGLDLAVKRWGAHCGYEFRAATRPEDICLEPGDRFDLSVCMETLEHLSTELVDGYLRKLAAHTRGHLLVTVPNEKGLVFLAKWLAKRIVFGDAEAYSLDELISATLGRMERVTRNEHKGFDYTAIIAAIDRYFDVCGVTGYPLTLLPKQVCPGIGIIARSRDAGGVGGRSR
jgi:2-polyprenyl-3-methyl-5-hydroxy-6-metoxy-1,4-benzoquinol methylase